MPLPNSIPKHRLSRPGDPYTSALSAGAAHGRSRLAIYGVATVMKTRGKLIDEEVQVECAKLGYVRHLSTIEHGRLALQEVGLIRPTGISRPTKSGSPAQEWIADDSLLEMDLDINQRAPKQTGHFRPPGSDEVRVFLSELVDLVDASGLDPSPTFLRVLRWLCSKYWKVKA